MSSTPSGTLTRLTSHVLDLEQGQPARHMLVQLRTGNTAEPVCEAVTDEDGRISRWTPETNLHPGSWELRFHAGAWYEAQGITNFHPLIVVQFIVEAERPHLHVPLLLNRFGYSTYRGS